MTVQTFFIHLSTRGGSDIHDLSAELARILQESSLRAGIITVFTPSSTSAVTTIEYEPGCVHDLQRLLDELVDPQREYQHNQRWHDGNGHSHLRAALLKASLTIPFYEGRLALGDWQQLVFIDFDNRPRKRELVVQVMGE